MLSLAVYYSRRQPAPPPKKQPQDAPPEMHPQDAARALLQFLALLIKSLEDDQNIHARNRSDTQKREGELQDMLDRFATDSWSSWACSSKAARSCTKALRGGGKPQLRLLVCAMFLVPVVDFWAGYKVRDVLSSALRLWHSPCRHTLSGCTLLSTVLVCVGAHTRLDL